MSLLKRLFTNNEVKVVLKQGDRGRWRWYAYRVSGHMNQQVMVAQSTINGFATIDEARLSARSVFEDTRVHHYKVDHPNPPTKY